MFTFQDYRESTNPDSPYNQIIQLNSELSALLNKKKRIERKIAILEEKRNKLRSGGGSKYKKWTEFELKNKLQQNNSQLEVVKERLKEHNEAGYSWQPTEDWDLEASLTKENETILKELEDRKI